MTKFNNIKVIKKFSNDDKNFQIIIDNYKKKIIKFLPKKKIIKNLLMLNTFLILIEYEK